MIERYKQIEDTHFVSSIILIHLLDDLEQLRPYVELGEYISENEDNVIDWAYLLSGKTQKIYADKMNEFIQRIKEQNNE